MNAPTAMTSFLLVIPMGKQGKCHGVGGTFLCFLMLK